MTRRAATRESGGQGGKESGDEGEREDDGHDLAEGGAEGDNTKDSAAQTCGESDEAVELPPIHAPLRLQRPSVPTDLRQMATLVLQAVDTQKEFISQVNSTIIKNKCMCMYCLKSSALTLLTVAPTFIDRAGHPTDHGGHPSCLQFT